MHQPTDRRPIASREKRVWKKLANIISRAGVSANVISIAGMIFGILCGVSFYLTTQSNYPRVFLLIGAGFCQLRLLCNMLDGMVAMESGKSSKLGELYNEVPDRISDSFALVGFGMIAGSSLSLGFIAALLAMLTAYVRAIGKAAGASQAFHGPMAKPHRMFIITIVAIGLAVAPDRFQAWAIHGYGIPSMTLLLISIGCLITAGRRLLAIAGQLR